MAISYEKQIYNMYEKEVAKNERLSKRCEKLQFEFNPVKKENKELQRKVDNIDEYINNKINKVVTQLTEKYEARIQKLEEQLKIKDNEIERLRNQINKNSTNSNKPSSTDMFPTRKEHSSASQYNYRQKTSRKNGGQVGHKGHCLDIKKIEEMITNKNVKVKEFMHEIKGSSKKEKLIKYKLGIQIRTMIEKHIFRYKETSQNKMPKEFYPDVTYDNSIKSLVIGLGGYETISYNRISSLIEMFSDGNIKLSEGSIKNFYEEFYDKSVKTRKNIENNVLTAEVMYTDETKGRCNGKLCFFRNYSNEENVLYKGHYKRGDKPIEEDNILPRYLGCIVADHDTGIYKYGKRHQECIVHTGRYLEEITQNVKETNWAKEMSNFFFRVNETRKLAKQYGEKQFDKEKRKELEQEYDDILEKAKLENRKIESTYYKAKAEKIRRRLIKYKESQLYYIKDFRVLFDNNMSERDLRMIKNKTKIAGGFRNIKGANLFAAVISIAKTSQKRKINPLESIKEVFDNKVLFGYEG